MSQKMLLEIEEHFDSCNFQFRLILFPSALAPFMFAMACLAIGFIYAGRMATATTAHSAKVILLWMLEPRMRTRITRPPIVDGVTFEAVAAKRRAVPARVTVTAHAGSGRAFKDHVLVASGAFHARVPAREREFGIVVAEGRIVPGGGLVAGSAGEREHALVRVVFEMAIGAGANDFGGGRGLVAGFAVHIHVRAVEQEGGGVVDEGGGSPRGHGVTRQTVRAEAKFVRLVVLVTPHTVARRGL